MPGINIKVNANNSGRKIQTVIIDPGHGGKDPGTIGLSGTYEKNVVLPISLKLKEYLSNGYGDLKIILTRDKDEFIELRNRGKIANENNGDLFISIHCNARKNDENDKNGFEIYMLDLNRLNEAIDITYNENYFLDIPKFTADTNKKKLNRIICSMAQNSFLKNEARFSNILQMELVKGTKLESRGVLQAGFFVLLGASMPTVLIESGYLSNKVEEEYLKSEKGQDEIAKSIYKSIRYFKFDYDYENMEK
jgi:N-acetylmuramoyl-L-alanine amidase